MTDDPRQSVWQLSSGTSNRSYTALLLRYGVGLISQGDVGPWSPEYDDEFEGGAVRRFATEVAQGDAFLLRTGTASIHAIGLVASEYMYLPQFDDVNGLDLQHGRRVRWYRLPQEYTFGASAFGARPARFSRVRSEEASDYAQRLRNSPPSHWQTSTLPDLPPEEPTIEEVPNYLQTLVGTALDFAANDLFIGSPCVPPTEDEMVAHFVVPLLRNLGWPPELIAVKWRNVDITIFDELPRVPENCRYIIEAKRVGAGIEGALSQARGYLNALSISKNVIVTDGFRYRMYSFDHDFDSIAYANLVRLKESALEFFELIKKA